MILLYISRFLLLGRIEDCVARVNEDLDNISNWSKGNELNLNPDKTICIVFSNNEICPNNFSRIVLDGNLVALVQFFK